MDMNNRTGDRIFAPARKFIVRRARRTQVLLRNCVPNAWRGVPKHSPPKFQHSRETQTSPEIKRQFSFDDDSNSYHSTESSLMAAALPVLNKPSTGDDDGFKSEPSHSGCSLDSGDISSLLKDFSQSTGWNSSELKMGSCPCLQHVACINSSTCSAHGNTLLEKFDELQHEVHMIHNTLRSLQSSNFSSSDQFTINIISETSTPPPPPPMPPPPKPLPQSFLLSVPQSAQPPLRRHESSLVVSNGVFSQDDGKPLITLEELQKVKLRKISSFSNNESHYRRA